VHFHEPLKSIVWATKRITWRLLSLNYYSNNFHTWKRVEATELRDKFYVYKLLTFQYYFSKVVVWLLAISRGGRVFASLWYYINHNFLKEHRVHRVLTPHNFLRLLIPVYCILIPRFNVFYSFDLVLTHSFIIIYWPCRTPYREASI